MKDYKDPKHLDLAAYLEMAYWQPGQQAKIVLRAGDTVHAGSSDEYFDPVWLTADEARQLAAWLVAAADHVERSEASAAPITSDPGDTVEAHRSHARHGSGLEGGKSMTFEESPQEPITPAQARERILEFLQARAEAGVQLAEPLTTVRLEDGVLTVMWDRAAVGAQKSDALLDLNRDFDWPRFVGVPLAFDNEEGRQLRQHIHTVRVIGPFGEQSSSARDLHRRATTLDREGFVS